MAHRLSTAVLVLLLLVIAPYSQNQSSLEELHDPRMNPANPTGVDLHVTEVSIAYTSTSDQSNFRMFSSNHPIAGFNRPANLYVIDGMVDVESTLTVTVENIGTANSGVVDITVTLLHNEYEFFEFVNTTVQMNGLSGGSSDTAQVPILPGYAGNHSMLIRATSTVADDDDSNNILNRHFTAGSMYFNCDTTTNWSFNPGWSLSTDTSISRGSSCHIGNGQSSMYANNMLTSMITPLMDMSDAVSSPLRTNGLSFYYTGSSAANDALRVYGTDDMGAWVQVATLSGTVDQSFFDGVNWQTFTLTDKGAASPLIPVPDALFHARSQFKFEFTSDATGTDVGFYLDEIVVVYDQKVKIGEFDVEAQGIATTGAIPGNWGSVTVQIMNTGNITETFVPTISGIPEEWASYFARPSGTSFDPSFGLTVRPGEPAQFNLMLMPDVNASIGYQQMSIDVVSKQYPNVNTTLPVQFLVKADRIPSIVTPPTKPNCPPTYSCSFDVQITNLGDATDVFDLMLDTTMLAAGWDVQYEWTQRESVLVRPLQPQSVTLVMSVPSTAAPDTVVQFGLTMTAQNDTMRVASANIDISASMISNASVLLAEHDPLHVVTVQPGEETDLFYTITNHASRQDIFAMRVDVNNLGQWIVDQPTRPSAVLNPGASATFAVTVTSPTTAQAGDRGPTLTPVIESERSQMVIEGEAFDGLRAASVHDVVLEAANLPSRVYPGQINDLVFNITNLGNGPASMTLSPDSLPFGWTYDIMQDEQVDNNSIELTPSYELNDRTSVVVQVFVPGDDDAGSRTNIQWSLVLNQGHLDNNPEDNTVEWTTLTAAVRSITMAKGIASAVGAVGQPVHAEALLLNRGNALEDRLSLRATFSTSPPTSDVVAFFTLSGGDRPIGEDVPFVLNGNSTMKLRMDLLLPNDVDLNTRLVVRFEVVGAQDDEGLPVTIEAEHLIVVQQRRHVNVTIQDVLFGDDPRNSPALIWINATSTSTNQESLRLNATYPADWQVVCNKRLLNSSGERIVLPPGTPTSKSSQTLCEVLNLGGASGGEVMFSLYSDDGIVGSEETLFIEFKELEAESGLSSTTVAIGGGGFAILVVLMVQLMRYSGSRRNTEDDIEKYTPPLQEHAPSGPPISTQISDDFSQDIEVEIEKRVDSEHPRTNSERSNGPPVPSSGLPEGWTMEQWSYYGQQYLDGTL